VDAGAGATSCATAVPDTANAVITEYTVFIHISFCKILKTNTPRSGCEVIYTIVGHINPRQIKING
jgi:hypothetical protein